MLHPNLPGSRPTESPQQMKRTIPFLIVLSLIFAACGSEAEETTTTTSSSTTMAVAAETTTTSTSTTTTTLPPGPSSPLTGLESEYPDQLDRRVVAIKIDNHANARPQSGLETAAAVYELPVEASLTRFIAMFHDQDSTYVGPNRSGRPTDPTLVKPLGATFVISGAQPWVQSVINNYDVDWFGEVRGPSFRISSRRAPHNLYLNTLLVRAEADRRGFPDDPPPDMFTWGEFPADAEPATEIFFDWTSVTKITWKWNGSGYERYIGETTHDWISEDGETTEPIEMDTLIVIYAGRYTASGSSGSAVPAMDAVGTGLVQVFSGGKVVEGTWSRDSADELFVLTNADGSTLEVPPGRPWINIFPDNRTVTW